MGRKCSECGKIGHNSRTCNSTSSRIRSVGMPADIHNGVLRLFGVQIDISSSSSSITPIKKSLSFDCLSLLSTPASSSSPSSSSSLSSSRAPIYDNSDSTFTACYLSDGPLIIHRAPTRRKGVPWTEDEHRTFLEGLEKLGKGDWRGISREYVSTKTPTQVLVMLRNIFSDKQISLRRLNVVLVSSIRLVLTNVISEAVIADIYFVADLLMM